MNKKERNYVIKTQGLIAFLGMLFAGVLIGVGMTQDNYFKIILAIPLSIISIKYIGKMIESIKK